jgi:hypothetical protein
MCGIMASIVRADGKTATELICTGWVISMLRCGMIVRKTKSWMFFHKKPFTIIETYLDGLIFSALFKQLDGFLSR